MAKVEYVPYGNGKKVSKVWHRILTEADRQRVGFTVTSGHRTEDEQRALFNQNMHRVNGRWVPKPGRPLTAWPSPTAPHIRTGRPDHALDVNSRDGGEARLERWIESQGAHIEWMNTVPGEPWHGEVSREDLMRLYRKFRPKPPPRPKTKTSAAGVDFIASFEGLRLKAYKAHPSERHWTIGHGHYGPDVKPGMTITRARARQLLRQDLRRFERAVVKHVPPRWRRQPYRFDALLSCAFNLGEGVLTPEPPLTSLGRALWAEEVSKANADRIAAAIRLYDKAGGERLAGLTRRRRAEARMFVTGSYSTK